MSRLPPPFKEIFQKQLTEARSYGIVITQDLFRSFFYAQKLEGKSMRTRITLACTECKQRNYNTTKDKKTHPERMETKKYCRFCRKHTLHKETK